MNEREKLWTDVYVAFVSSRDGYTADVSRYAKEAANEAVRDFDEWRAKEGKNDTKNHNG